MVILLVTSIPSTTIIEGDQHSLRNILKGHKIKTWHEVDGSQMENKQERNTLFGISGKKGEYPQVFLKSASGETRFVGNFEQVQNLNECAQLPPATLAARPDLDTFDKVFASVMGAGGASASTPAAAPTVPATSSSSSSGGGGAASGNAFTGLGRGCYLTHEANNQGTLVITWATVSVADAIGFFRPTKDVAKFKFTQGGGRSELIRQVNGGMNVKSYCRGKVTY